MYVVSCMTVFLSEFGFNQKHSHFYGPGKSTGETEYLRKYLTQFCREIGFRLSVCLIISVFCKSCEPICEPDFFSKKFCSQLSG